MSISKISCRLSRDSASAIAKTAAFDVELDPRKWEWANDANIGSGRSGLGTLLRGGDSASLPDTTDLGLAHGANMKLRIAAQKLKDQENVGASLAASKDHMKGQYENAAQMLGDAREWIKTHPGMAAGAGIGAGALGAAGMYYAGKGFRHRNDDED